MSCALRYPESTDLTQSRFLWPLDLTSPNTLESSTGGDHRGYIETEIVHLYSFRKSLLSFAKQAIHELHKPKNLRGGVASVPSKNPPATYSNTYRSTFIPKKESDFPPTSQNSPYSKPQSQTPTSSPVRRKCLKPPPPRFSSPLSPNLPGTILNGNEERRPIPSTRKKEEVLYRAVLEKAMAANGGTPLVRAKSKAHPVNSQSTSGSRGDRYHNGLNQTRMMPRFNRVGSNGCGRRFGLSDSWVVVPPDMGWDIVKRDDIII